MKIGSTLFVHTLVNGLTPVDATHVATAGPAMKLGIGLWPFVAAYLNKRISYEQLELACKRVLGEAGVALASRLAWA